MKPLPIPFIRKNLCPENRLIFEREMAEFFSNWEATAELDAAPEVLAAIREAQEEYKRGECVPWEEVKKQMGLKEER